MQRCMALFSLSCGILLGTDLQCQGIKAIQAGSERLSLNLMWLSFTLLAAGFGKMVSLIDHAYMKLPVPHGWPAEKN